MDKIPSYMRERVAYLIDQKVERRVREFMEEFRQEIYGELAEQRRQNEEHIQYYAQQKLGPLPKAFVPTQPVTKVPVVKSRAPVSNYSTGTLPLAQPYTKSPARASQPLAYQPVASY